MSAGQIPVEQFDAMHGGLHPMMTTQPVTYAAPTPVTYAAPPTTVMHTQAPVTTYAAAPTSVSVPIHQPVQYVEHQQPVHYVEHHQPAPMMQMPAQMGGVTQVPAHAHLYVARERATVSQHTSTTMMVKEQGQTVHVVGETVEIEAPAQYLEQHHDQAVAGETRQHRVEIPTVQEVIQYMDVPETQIIEKHVEVPQIVHTEVEVPQIQIVHVPKIVNQHRVSHRHVEQIVHTPVEVPQIQIVHVPKVVNQHRVSHRQVEHIVEVPVPQVQIVHVP